MAESVLNGPLARALAAFEQREEEEALLRLLEVWRESRSERIAALVERVSDRLIAGMPRLPCQPFSPAMQQQRPIDLPRMLDGLLETAKQGLVEPLCRQLEGFRKWPADPRLTPALAAIARLNVTYHRQVLQDLCGLFMYLRDSRSLEALRRLGARQGAEDRHGGQFEGVIELITLQELPPLDAETRALVDALEEAIGARAEAEARSAPVREALLARVYAHPEDDSARLVLADHLLEQGDPLGDFIMLQCASQPDEARVRALLGKYAVPWQAPLGPLIAPSQTRFERGFPVAVQMAVERRQPLPPPGPAWGTVEAIDWNWSGPPEGAAWLADPHLHAVTQLSRTRAAIGRRLGAHALRLRSLELQGRLTVEAPEIFTALAALPHLTRVDLPDADPRDVSLCANSPLARRLERFTASVLGAWTLAATPSEEVTVAVTLLSSERFGQLAAVIRDAVGFGTRGLRLHSPHPLDSQALAMLEGAAAAYAHVEWV
ncbi:TIGR02996 domain-containing protein [Pyxidicoccus trucidator]|uniref:TIGR02996 domain-containing protein n=1 Tax=Pyxidicoccus trucidator TaxID=2709662 RepID=UPI0013DA8F47|nr:TIGR02996 domain-containing protein [Pyxidicoccus trucidator]